MQGGKSSHMRAAHREHIPTPSTANGTGGSKFTKLAKNLAKEIEASQRWISDVNLDPASPGRRRAAKQQSRRNPLHDVANRPSAPTVRPRRDRVRTVSAPLENGGRQRTPRVSAPAPKTGDIILPDVTGLTSVIASPVRSEIQRRPYLGGHDGEQVEGQNNLQFTIYLSKCALQNNFYIH